MADIETPVYIDDILKILDWNLAKYKRRCKELHEAGAIYYELEGFPPRRRVKAYPSRLIKYQHLYSKEKFSKK